ncbi:hypothetical protein IV203_001654 [Nitzschia inconspicua]|uniref:Uncharacterized protein n=1 Tax=Nitzschia inconspicua TaxID=303405 RepID=A0A9K3PRQ3_9STRA|nr:hypothetical protein IV203_001654 [Nitzschia inconspicua]
MAMKKRGERPGKGAKCSVLTRFIYPKQNVTNSQQRSEVVLVAREERMVNRKLQRCFTFVLDGNECFANERYCKVLQEGKKEDLFEPFTCEEETVGFKEPRIKWKKSKAKDILTYMIIQGDISDDPNDPTPVDDIFIMCEEFCKYDRSKFPARLKTLRLRLKDMWKRADDDLIAFENYKSNHAPSLFSHKGYAQWQGSDAQMFLLEDLDEYEKNPNTSPYDLWITRQEYMDEYPLAAFAKKIEQEILEDLIVEGKTFYKENITVTWDDEIPSLKGDGEQYSGLTIQMNVDPRWAWDRPKENLLEASIYRTDTILIGFMGWFYDQVHNNQVFSKASDKCKKQLDEAGNNFLDQPVEKQKRWIALKVSPRSNVRIPRLSIREIHINPLDLKDETSIPIQYYPNKTSHAHLPRKQVSWYAQWTVVVNDAADENPNKVKRMRGKKDREPLVSAAAQQAAQYSNIYDDDDDAMPDRAQS